MAPTGEVTEPGGVRSISRLDKNWEGGREPASAEVNRRQVIRCGRREGRGKLRRKETETQAAVRALVDLTPLTVYATMVHF